MITYVQLGNPLTVLLSVIENNMLAQRKGPKMCAIQNEKITEVLVKY